MADIDLTQSKKAANDSENGASIQTMNKAETEFLSKTVVEGSTSSSPVKNNKENHSPQKKKSGSKGRLSAEFLDWREPESSKPSPSPKSKGFAPKSFHRRRGRDEGVQELHKTVHENVKKEEIKRLSKEQHVKRSAFREVTSLKTWPLQDMAMQDYQQLLAGHLHEQESKTKDENDKDQDNNNRPQPDYEHGGSSSSGNSAVDTKRQVVDKDISPNKSQLKNRYKHDFLLERNIPAHNVLTPSSDPAIKFDSGLWSMEPRIFSIEKAKGKRKYLVGHLGRVMDLIWRKTDRSSRHLYELILEKTPCRLYFDLEFSIPDNPDISEEELLEEFYTELIKELNTAFPDHTEGLDRTCIVDLDSSTATKFSRHWIVHLPTQALFEDSQHVGRFVKRFIQRLADDVASGQLKECSPMLQKYLFVNPKGALQNDSESSGTGKPSKLQQKTCFVDLGVYTRNRLFRLLASSKFGKTPDCALRIASTNQFPFPKGFSNECFYVPAMPKSQDSSDNSDSSDDEQDVQLAKEKFQAMMDWTLHAQALCSTLIVPMNATKIDYPLLPSTENEANDSSDNNAHKISQYCTSTAKSTTTSTIYHSYGNPTVHHGQSPYPYLDEFILEHLANRGGIQGSIRAWTMDFGPPMNNDSSTNAIPVGISFQMSRNRWCECVGRHHKSNNIMWNINFQTKQCVQSCYDPECRSMNFRCTPVDLPYEVAEQLEDALMDELVAQMDDSELRGEAGTTTTVGDSNKQGEISLERALQGLDLNSNGGGDGERQESAPVKQETKPAEPTFEELTDDDLLDAMLSNPELFP